MAALTTGRETKERNIVGKMSASYIVTSGETVYVGGMVCFAASADTVSPAADTSGFRFAGIAQSTVVGDGTLEVEVTWGYEALLDRDSNITAADVGLVATVSDDQTVDDAGGTTNDVEVGVISQLEGSTQCWVHLRQGPVNA